MTKPIQIELTLPGNYKNLKMPAALRHRLNDLLDKQDSGTKLSVKERKEAEALVDLAEMLTLLKLKARVAELNIAAKSA
jgi:hypothetical protein